MVEEFHEERADWGSSEMEALKERRARYSEKREQREQWKWRRRRSNRRSRILWLAGVVQVCNGRNLEEEEGVECEAGKECGRSEILRVKDEGGSE